MKKCVVSTIAGLLTLWAASPICWAQVKFDGGPTGLGAAFLDGANWNPDGVPGVIPTDRYAINDGFTSTYATSATTTVLGLRIGTDAPVSPTPTGTPGTLNMSDGVLIVSGGGDSFEIGRACCAGTGVMNMTGDAVLEIQGSDPLVGDRDQGTLNIGDTASVISTRPDGAYWRIGNYGPSIDAGLEGNGLLNVYGSGSFRAHVLLLATADGDGEVRVSDNGSVALTGNMAATDGVDQPNRSALVHMIGSNATLTAVNLESANGLSQVHNQYEFSADLGGVSEIKLSNAVNITNNNLTVNLNSFVLGPGGTALLFDAAPNQVYGTFASVAVNGGNPAFQYAVRYDQAAGDILLERIPEPSTIALAGLGLVAIATRAKRRVTIG
jgi:hypothetical protein